MRTDELQPIGATIESFLRIEETGGTCSREGCDADAPVLILDHKRTALPCAKHGEEERVASERDEVAHKASLLLPRSGMTERLRQWSLDSYRRDCGDAAGREALAVAEKWLADFYGSARRIEGEDPTYSYSTSMLFFGPVGCGKTGLGWAIIRDLCENGVEARIVTFRKLLEDMRTAYSEKISVHKYLASVIRAPVLCLDDLGSETPTKWVREQLLGIVDYRYERRLPTIYVSNYRPSELADRLSHEDPVIGERIVSRMTDRSIQHRFAAGDRRTVAKAAA